MDQSICSDLIVVKRDAVATWNVASTLLETEGTAVPYITRRRNETRTCAGDQAQSGSPGIVK